MRILTKVRILSMECGEGAGRAERAVVRSVWNDNTATTAVPRVATSIGDVISGVFYDRAI